MVVGLRGELLDAHMAWQFAYTSEHTCTEISFILSAMAQTPHEWHTDLCTVPADAPGCFSELSHGFGDMYCWREVPTGVLWHGLYGRLMVPTLLPA